MRTSKLPGWLVRVLAGVVLTQAALYLARPVTSYRALALGADARAVGLITAAFALVPWWWPCRWAGPATAGGPATC